MIPLNVFDVDFNGFNLVEASAGTGKTYNITSFYIRALTELNVSPSEILVLTFTEDATAELKQRIRLRIQECISALEGEKFENDTFLKDFISTASPYDLKRLQKALFSFDEAVISTIHGFCQKLLREFSLDLNVQADFEILNDTSEIIQENVDSMWRSFIKNKSNSDDGKSLISYLISEGINPENLSALIKKVLGKPYADLKPNETSEDEIKRITQNIKQAYNQIQNRWEDDQAQLREIIFSGNMHGGWYKKSTFESLFIEFERWVSTQFVQLKGFDRLVSFGAEKIQRGTNKGYDPELPLICELIDEYLAITEQMDQVRSDFLIKTIRDVEKKIDAQKEKENVLSFDDLLQKVDQNLTPKLQQKIAQKYPIALVDEFQDTDPVQYSIFKNIFKDSKSALFMIGDPKQAIYSFRGADLFTYFRATEDVSEAKKYSLDYNYRSNREMISAVNEIFDKNDHPFVYEKPEFRPAKYPNEKTTPHLTYSGKSCIPFSFVDCEFEGRKEPTQEVICEYVSDQIDELLRKDYKIGNRRVEPKDIAVLVRRGKEAEAVQAALNKKDIKSSLKTRESVFKSIEGEDLLIILKAISDTANISLIRAALVTSLIGFKAQDLIDLKNNERKWEEILHVFLKADELYESKGLIAAFKALDTFFKIKETLAQNENPERRLTNLDHLLELLNKREQRIKNSLYSLIRFLKKKLKNDSTPSDDELIRLESDSELVTISTLHSSKGLQYSIVFVPFLWDNFESSSMQGLNFTEYHDDENQLCIDLSKNPDLEILEKSKSENLADSLRLNYVAFTRAKYACIVPFAQYSSVIKSSLFATVCGPESLLDEAMKSNDKRKLFEERLLKLGATDNIEYITSSDKINESLDDALVIKDDDERLPDNLRTRVNNRNDLFSFKRMLSFSSISPNHATDNPKDYDEFEITTNVEILEEPKDLELSKLSFPKGTDTGNLLHYIFEDITFNDADTLEQVISDKTESLGFESKWNQILTDWISEVLIHPLKDEIKLSNLKESSILKEMEFHFPVNGISAEQFLSLIRDKKAESSNASELLSGYMKGFIDLIFEHNGKYYILDYKSNFLGNELNDYDYDKLQEAMISSNYDLQYHIYSLALVKYLKRRIPSFNYENHFGGVFYLFLRGVETVKLGSGVFFDKPEEELIQKIDALIGGSH